MDRNTQGMGKSLLVHDKWFRKHGHMERWPDAVDRVTNTCSYDTKELRR